LTPLVAGHNDLDADRINLVFAPWGWDDPEEFARVTKMHLGWDGTAQRFDVDGRPSDPDEAVGADLGLFGFEPFRSNRDLFNVWVTEVSPDSPVAWINALEPDPVELANLVLITMALDAGRVLPSDFSLAGQDHEIYWPDPERLSDDPFANVMIAVPGYFPAQTLRVLPHELGHAMFALPDEYVGRAQGYTGDRNSFYPSCPADRATAEAWWGDRVGEPDPSIDIWVEELTAAGFPPEPALVAAIRADTMLAFVEGGCFEVEGSYRMANDTLMGFGTPGFGPANLEAAQTVLDLFAG
jgi:hypothetical protein